MPRCRRCHGHPGSRAEPGRLTVEPRSVTAPLVRPSHTWHRTTSRTRSQAAPVGPEMLNQQVHGGAIRVGAMEQEERRPGTGFSDGEVSALDRHMNSTPLDRHHNLSISSAGSSRTRGGPVGTLDHDQPREARPCTRYLLRPPPARGSGPTIRRSSPGSPYSAASPTSSPGRRRTLLHSDHRLGTLPRPPHGHAHGGRRRSGRRPRPRCLPPLPARRESKAGPGGETRSCPATTPPWHGSAPAPRL
jgi:hypothetical protein